MYRDITFDDLQDELMHSSEHNTLKCIENLIKKYWHPRRKPSISVVGGVPQQFMGVFLHDSNEQMLERHSLYEYMWQSKSLTLTQQIEIITMGIVYREPPKNAVFFTNDGHIYHIVDVWAKPRGFLGFLIRDIELQTYYLFVKGSDFHPSGLDALSSYINDIEWCIGSSGIDSIRDDIKLMWQRNRQLYKISSDVTLTLCGHSLGGALVQQLYVDLYPTYSQNLYLFNSPGVPYSFHTALNHKIKQYNIIGTIKSFVTKGDVVHFTNGYQLGAYIPWNRDHYVTLTITTIVNSNPLQFNNHAYMNQTNAEGKTIYQDILHNEENIIDNGEDGDDDDDDDEPFGNTYRHRMQLIQSHCKPNKNNVIYAIRGLYYIPVEIARLSIGIGTCPILCLHRSIWRTIFPSRLKKYL